MHNGMTLLVLGGKPIGSCELVEYAHSRGARVIVADYLPKEDSPAKLLADECWDISTADVELLASKCETSPVDGILTGVHEFNIAMMAKLSSILNLPCYCTEDQQLLCINKRSFKERCMQAGIPVAQEFPIEGIKGISQDRFPLAVKPKDGSGSRGFSKCLTTEDLPAALKKAAEHSASNSVLIEEFIEAEAVIVHYTAHRGHIMYSGMADKHSEKIGSDGSPIMALQLAPSVHETEYLQELNAKAISMLSSMEIKEGPVWIEAFHTSERFVFNEMGYRFGGSLSYHLVKELCGIDQLDLLYDQAMGIEASSVTPTFREDKLYAIWPIHIRTGVISQLIGFDELVEDSRVAALVKVHDAGDEIGNWGSAQQVLAYVHVVCKSARDIINFMEDALKNLRVVDRDGNDMLFALFDPRNAKEGNMDWPPFLEQRIRQDMEGTR